MKNKNYILGLIISILLMGCTKEANKASSSVTDTANSTVSSIVSFSNVSVHDPSIIKDNGTYYIVGSHLAFAKSTNLKDWTQLESSVTNGNRLFPTPFTTLADIFNYTSDSDTTNRSLWAGDMIKMNGKYYYYLSACEGSSPLSELAVSISSKVDGPYSTPTQIFRSGGAKAADGTSAYSASTQPNAVDPAVFFNAAGTNLYMVYGSYSGGIYVTELDTTTGLPKNKTTANGKGWGTKLLGNNHARIEAPYVIYNKDTKYYYLYLSFGGLSYDGNYNVRVARSKNPTGPFYDAQGESDSTHGSMINCKGTSSPIFNDYAVSDYGMKILGNYTWNSNTTSGNGYVSPGHNSAYYDATLGKYFIIFHTRFPNAGANEGHQIRVHEMKFNAQGWPVVLPFRYTTLDESESITSMTGTYKVIVDKDEFNGTSFKPTIKTPVNYVFNSNKTVTGTGITSGTWSIDSSNRLTVTINGTAYYGFIQKQYNEFDSKTVISFSVLNTNGYGMIAYQ